MPDDLTDPLHNAISGVLKDVGMVNRWTLAVEVIESESGERPVHHYASEELMLWEVLGLAESAAAVARAQIASDLPDADE